MDWRTGVEGTQLRTGAALALSRACFATLAPDFAYRAAKSTPFPVRFVPEMLVRAFDLAEGGYQEGEVLEELRGGNLWLLH
eukprot:3263454-Rhodomonas_salina.1